MTREEVKKLLPILQAFGEGETIEYRMKYSKEDWRELLGTFPSTTCDLFEYRVKPQPTYRPFKDAKECWKEMQKHQPFGWRKLIGNRDELHYSQIGIVADKGCEFDFIFQNYTFADGEPFGIKE